MLIATATKNDAPSRRTRRPRQAAGPERSTDPSRCGDARRSGRRCPGMDPAERRDRLWLLLWLAPGGRSGLDGAERPHAGSARRSRRELGTKAATERGAGAVSAGPGTRCAPRAPAGAARARPEVRQVACPQLACASIELREEDRDDGAEQEDEEDGHAATIVPSHASAARHPRERSYRTAERYAQAARPGGPITIKLAPPRAVPRAGSSRRTTSPSSDTSSAAGRGLRYRHLGSARPATPHSASSRRPSRAGGARPPTRHGGASSPLAVSTPRRPLSSRARCERLGRARRTGCCPRRRRASRAGIALSSPSMWTLSVG